LAVFGPIVFCCVAYYLRWQLLESTPDGVAPERVSGASALNPCAFLSDAPGRSPASTRGHAASPVRRQPVLPQAPGVYVAGSCDALDDGRDAAIRGELLADRIIKGRFDARHALRRGKKGALDVIVVGANALGVSAATHLIQAGLRVLLIDRDGAAPLADIPELPRALHGSRRAARLALLAGHSVYAVAERADGMLEVQAERAAWYTANVIFASTESLVEAARAAAAPSATSRAA
jgi:hypothetical protein